MELQDNIEEFEALDTDIIAIAQLEQDPAMLERIERFVGPDITIVADPDQVSREPFEIFGVYIVEQGGQLATRIGGEKEARAQLDVILGALAALDEPEGEAVVAATGSRTATGDRAAASSADVLTTRWMWSHDFARPGDPLRLALLPETAPGWHVYGPGSEVTLPLAVNVELPDGVELETPIGMPPPTLESDPVLEVDIPIYRGEIPLDALRMRVTDDAEPGLRTVRITIAYQACDSSVCLPPADLLLELPIEVRVTDAERGQVYGWQTW